jgi:hypothetical protein
MKPRQGKAKVKVTAGGKKVSYGQKGASVKPGTSKGDSYCARSAGQMKKHPKAAKDPNSPLRLSRKRWKCSGTKSRRS